MEQEMEMQIVGVEVGSNYHSKQEICRVEILSLLSLLGNWEVEQSVLWS